MTMKVSESECDDESVSVRLLVESTCLNKPFTMGNAGLSKEEVQTLEDKTHYTQAEIKELHKAFKERDADNSGNLDKDEFMYVSFFFPNSKCDSLCVSLCVCMCVCVCVCVCVCLCVCVCVCCVVCVCMRAFLCML